MDKLKYSEEQLEFFRKAGAKGGRKATVPHKLEGYCRCAECRKRRGEWGGNKEEVKSTEKEGKSGDGYDWGA